MHRTAADDETLVAREIGIPLVAGGYGTVLADPPWSFSDKGSRAAPDWKQAPIYSTMRAEDILSLPVDVIAAPRAHLYVWTTDAHLPLALNCMREWGFAFKKILVWVKRNLATTPIRCDAPAAEGELVGEDEFTTVRGPLQIGMGHYYRSAKEIVLFGVRGGGTLAVKNLPDVFEAPRTRHSRKPDKLHEWAEIASPGPRIELFARRSREGWEAWGDQFPGHDAYLRALEKERARQASLRAGGAKRRAAKRERVDWEALVQGVSQWPARCAECERMVTQGESVWYIPDASVSVCWGCREAREQVDGGAADGAAAPF